MRQAVFADIISYSLPHALWAVHFCSLIAIYLLFKETIVIQRCNQVNAWLFNGSLPILTIVVQQRFLLRDFKKQKFTFFFPYSYLSFWQGRIRCSSSFQRFVPMFRTVSRPWECPLINGGKAGKDFQKHSVTIHYSASSSALRCLVSQRVLSTFYFQTAPKP